MGHFCVEINTHGLDHLVARAVRGGHGLLAAGGVDADADARPVCKGSADSLPLDVAFWRCFRWRVLLGIPALFAFLAIFWLMVSKRV